MADASKEYTEFSTYEGRYQFKVLSFGLCNEPSTFQRLMECVLRGLNWQICLIYTYDVIIFSKTFEEHLQHLQRILGVDNIKEKYQKNLFSVASAIIEVAKEMKAKNSKEELAKIMLLLVADSDVEEADHHKVIISKLTN